MWRLFLYATLFYNWIVFERVDLCRDCVNYLQIEKSTVEELRHWMSPEPFVSFKERTIGESTNENGFLVSFWHELFSRFRKTIWLWQRSFERLNSWKSTSVNSGIGQHNSFDLRSRVIIKMAIQELDWEVVPYPTYSSHLASLSLSLSNNLGEISFNDYVALQNGFDEFFTSKLRD